MSTEKTTPSVNDEHLNVAADTDSALPNNEMSVTELKTETIVAEQSEIPDSENAESEKAFESALTVVEPAGLPAVVNPEKNTVAETKKKPMLKPESEPKVEHAEREEVAESEKTLTVVSDKVKARMEEDESEKEGLDFSDEEAELAAEAPEFDLGDDPEEDQEEEEEVEDSGHDFDLADKSKEQLLDLFAELLSEKPIQVLRKEVEAIKVAFYKKYRAEVEHLRKQFIDNGGSAEDFVAPADNEEQRLKYLFGEYRKRRDEFISNLERSKEDNLKAKLQIIEDLKELINGSETLNNTFQAFRELQQRWKDAGPVPQANVKDLWDTYNHHVENFYSYIKINKELRDLDLKKNYEAKVDLCEEAEALILDPSIVNAFHKLQKLHEQWREIGPVANEYKDSLWERFREASSRINKQHQDFFEGLKEEQKRNLDLKTELCAKAEELTSGVWTTRKEWNKVSDKLLELQKVWKTIGFAPKKDNVKIYERFRNACDKFFEQKRLFYLQVKAEMEHNLELKNEICEAAEAIKNSEEWKKTTDELIALQKKWKEIGPVARRHSDAIWRRFRTACDYFFNRKSDHFQTKDAEYEQNLARKRELLAEIEAADILTGGFDMVKDFQRRWSEIGFVPIKLKDAIQKEYKEVMDKVFAILRSSGQNRQMDRFRSKVENMKGSGDRRLRFERDRLYNKLKQLESDIALLENNIGFFSKSKNADAMVKEVKIKIEKAKEEMTEIIEKINLIDNQG